MIMMILRMNHHFKTANGELKKFTVRYYSLLLINRYLIIAAHKNLQNIPE